jgi:phage terminase large subunit
MLSYDYSHFETALTVENENGLSLTDVDNARKQCQRLADKAVSQYKKAKEMAELRTDGTYKMQNFEQQCKRILQKPEGERTVNEVAMLKQYQDENWESQFDDPYDYDDDEIYNLR